MIYKLITTLFFVGYLPASGTFGTFFSIPLVILLKNSLNFKNYVFTSLVFYIISVFICNKVESFFKREDPSEVILDELIGFMFVFILNQINLFNLIIGFILFRFFDIKKPLFINNLQNLKGGLGIVSDDVLAGIYSCIIIYIINFSYYTLI